MARTPVAMGVRMRCGGTSGGSRWSETFFSIVEGRSAVDGVAVTADYAANEARANAGGVGGVGGAHPAAGANAAHAAPEGHQQDFILAKADHLNRHWSRAPRGFHVAHIANLHGGSRGFDGESDHIGDSAGSDQRAARFDALLIVAEVDHVPYSVRASSTWLSRV